jgi:GNAT superfamily N-acetyltransferase
MRPTVSSAAVRLVPADSIELDALVALFNEAYSDYVVPMRLDRSGLEFTLGVCDVDLGASRVAVVADEPAAFALLGQRGDEGWIAGMGTIPDRRRNGLGEAALREVVAEARGRGLGSVRLEVITSNAPARALYVKLGFEHERDLVVWMLEQTAVDGTGTSPLPETEASAWIAANRQSVEPWQRADETREHMRARGLEFEAFKLEDGGRRLGAVVYQPDPTRPRVTQIAAQDEGVAGALLAAVAARGEGFRFLNAPADEPASLACERLGARPEVRQHEMCLPL